MRGGGPWRLVDGLYDTAVWRVARGVVDAVRYRPRQLDLALACGAWQPEVPEPAVRWLADARARPGVLRVVELPHAALRAVAAEAARWFGPTGSALVRWTGAVVAGTSDGAVTTALQRPLRARAHPGLLVPHPHALAVLAADMRGFSNLTRTLSDTQYLANLVGEYLTALTGVVERHRGIVFQYTGDGLLALFLPELFGRTEAAMLDELTQRLAPDLHGAFDALYARWRTEWTATARPHVAVGLGLGLCFGRATIGFLGPAGKKHFGVIGEPVNLAAYLCSQARAGTLLVDRDSFARAAAVPPAARAIRLRAKKRHHRIDVLCLSWGRGEAGRFRWRPA
jgi:class 3 adenylate cyclase